MPENIYKSAMWGNIVQLQKELQQSTVEEINKKEKGMKLSPLALAVQMVQVESVKMLLAYGADPNTENVYGQTPLFYVGEKQPVEHDTPEQRFKIAQMLLDAGADINHCDHSNNQPLWIAVFYLKGEMDLPLVKLFLERGANIYNKNKANRSPLDFAKQVGYSPVINLLEKYR